MRSDVFGHQLVRHSVRNVTPYQTQYDQYNETDFVIRQLPSTNAFIGLNEPLDFLQIFVAQSKGPLQMKRSTC